MGQTELTGKVQTVLGAINPDQLGATSCHEHILFDMSAYFMEPSEVSEKSFAHQPVTLDNLHWVRAHRFNNLDNMQQTDEQIAIKELLLFKSAGGGAIVEMSQIGLSRNPLGLARIAKATGINIIMGSGYYLGLSHPKDLATKTEDEIAEEIVRDIMVGVGTTGVHSGIIGEIGCSSPLLESERKVLRAAAIGQRKTGAAINIHPSFSDELVLEIIEILSKAGADLTRTVISHVELFDFSLATRRKLANAGCFIEYDNFGHLGYPHLYLGRMLNLTSDIQRINDIMQLIDEGYMNQILIGQDHCFKDGLTTYGGYGYAHLLNNVVPLMRSKGISDKQIDIILVGNPKRILQFVPTD